jgi:hypothetical protein
MGLEPVGSQQDLYLQGAIFVCLGPLLVPFYIALNIQISCVIGIQRSLVRVGHIRSLNAVLRTAERPPTVSRTRTREKHYP